MTIDTQEQEPVKKLINARLSIRQLEVEKAKGNKSFRMKIELAEKHRHIIEQFPEDFSWYVTSFPCIIHLYAYIKSDEQVKDLCRLTRNILGIRTSTKKLDTSNGTITYQHLIPGLSVDIEGGKITQGCILIPKTTWHEAYSLTRYEIDCGGDDGK